MRKAVLYYITGHGFGHARRSAEIIRALTSIAPDVDVHIATTANPAIFDDLPRPQVRLRAIGLDPGAIEDSVLSVSVHRTAEQVCAVLRQKDRIIDAEVYFVRQSGVRLIIADAPFLAGDVADAAGLPCAAATNFTWDWIYEPWFASDPRHSGLLQEIQSSYARMQAILKMPFGGRTDMFRQVIHVPLVVNQSRRSRDQIARSLGLDMDDQRPLVLIGQRGGLPGSVLDHAARGAADFRFLCLQEPPASAPGNLIHVRLGGELQFSDLIKVSDVIVSKLGYGTVSECIAAGVGILWPARTGFREDKVMSCEATPYVRMRQLATADFNEGNWREGLEALMQIPAPVERMRSDGADCCARKIVEWLNLPGRS